MGLFEGPSIPKLSRFSQGPGLWPGEPYTPLQKENLQHIKQHIKLRYPTKLSYPF